MSVSLSIVISSNSAFTKKKKNRNWDIESLSQNCICKLTFEPPCIFVQIILKNNLKYFKFKWYFSVNYIFSVMVSQLIMLENLLSQLTIVFDFLIQGYLRI